MAIKIPSGYIKICEYSIDNASERKTKEGKILKNAFRIGPSKSVVTKGKIIIDSEGVGSSSDEEDKEKDKTEKPAEDNKEEKPTESSEAPKESEGGSDEGSSEKPNESYNYSMLEAYFNMHQIYEADDEESSDKSDEASDEQSDSEESSDDEEQKKEEPKKDDEDNEQEAFEPGPHMYVQVWLPKEGCSVWHIQLDKRADADAVRAAIQAKKFKTAHLTASKGLGVDGLVPLSVETYISAKAESHAPFIGHCRYAMDSGSEDSAADSNTVCIAIAPIDGRTNKPSEATVFKVSYNVVGDISNGEIDKLIKKSSKDNGDDDDKEISNKDLLKAISKKNKDTDDDSGEEKTVSDYISKWLNAKFKCVGDQGMYDNFIKLRGFVTKQVAEKNLEYDQGESETPKHYRTVSEVKKSLIYY